MRAGLTDASEALNWSLRVEGGPELELYADSMHKGDCTQGNKRRSGGEESARLLTEAANYNAASSSKEDGDSDHRNPKNDYGKPRSLRVAISEAPE